MLFGVVSVDVIVGVGFGGCVGFFVGVGYVGGVCVGVGVGWRDWFGLCGVGVDGIFYWIDGVCCGCVWLVCWCVFDV